MARRIPLDMDEIERSYVRGMGAEEIAMRRQVSANTIANRLKERGVWRNRQEAGELRRGRNVKRKQGLYMRTAGFKTLDRAIEKQSFVCSERGFVTPGQCLDCYENDTFRRLKMSRRECMRRHIVLRATKRQRRKVG